MTSHDVVAILRKKLNMKRIGHTGTLDPMATGVLPICIENSTRISEYIMNQGKSYIATLKFGESTTTYDSEGEITNISDNVSFTSDEINKVLKTFLGDISQTPPIYSAIKVNGKKLYEYARDNEKIEIKSRKVTVYDIKLLEIKNEFAKIYINCSKGTYIRSIIHDLGIKLNSYAHMTELIRTRVGHFDLENSIDISKIDSYSLEDLENSLISINDALYNFESIEVTKIIRDRLVNGQRINIKDLINIKIPKDEEIKIISENEFIGIAKINNNILKMEKMLWQR
ncbi:tRNA pseudouridine(55) synthase TruB [Helcococcus sueciensis]|uniref:tRNA pseudouridine(55) synthase TruB n=1 Tax=Helcococcus sueciensis TaxID=241555 RepID=UPI00146B53C5|nr:tRNA pseudouridine(55) synthase TruB [Helcococcus sueciensis]